MFAYGLKRLVRGWGGFIALFLGVTIATTLFAGTILGAEKVGFEMLDEAMDLVPVDIITADLVRDVTAVDYSDLEEEIGQLENVVNTEQVIRWTSMINWVDYFNAVNNVNFDIAAVEENSTLWYDVFGPGSRGVRPGEIYIDVDSSHAPDLEVGMKVTLVIFTHNPISPPGFKTFYTNLTVAGFVDVDLESYIKVSEERPDYVSSILFGSGQELHKPPHDLLFVHPDSFLPIFSIVYYEGRLPNKELTYEILVEVDRDRVVNPWDIAGSIDRVRFISEQIDNEVRIYQLHSWQSFLEDILVVVQDLIEGFKTGFVVLALPVFFTAWYVGVTVSDVMLGSRRREVGLLLTKGFTPKQVFMTFLVESGLVGVLSGLTGLVASSIILPFVGIGSTSVTGFSFVSASTVAFIFIFSITISVLSVLLPAWRVSNMSVIDALKEHESFEAEKLPSRLEPAVALILGLYKLLMLLFGISVDSFAPTGGGMIVQLLYTTWWGFDLLLSYLGPILFFWGFTKLFIQGSFRIQEMLGAIAERFIGELSKVSTLSAQRSLRRTTAIAFLIALIFGYSVSVVGGLATSRNQMYRNIQWNIGSDASIWLFSEKGYEELVQDIEALNGVASTAVERWFYAESAYVKIPVRAIDPDDWAETAYYEEEWFTLGSEAAFTTLAARNDVIMMNRGFEQAFKISKGDLITFNIRFNVYVNQTIVEFFGPSTGAYNLPSYVPDGFLDEHQTDLDVINTVILVRLEPGADAEGFKAAVMNMSNNVKAIYTLESGLESASSNIFLQGPIQMQRLGITFATLVSSLGVALVVSTTLGERQKEITLMAIRGFSFKQLFQMLIVENLGVLSFSIILGAIVGYINVIGDVKLSNLSGGLILRRVIFDQGSLTFIAAIVVVILLSAIIPIIVALRRSSSKLSWRLIE